MELVTKKIDEVPGVSRRQQVSDRLLGLSLYADPPRDELSLDEFESFALDRLQLLRNIENLKVRGFEGLELKDKLKIIENKYMPLRHLNATSFDDGIRKDVASHFILRLAYCRTQDLRQWLIEQECTLFRYRLEKLQDADRSEFMSRNGLDYDVVSSTKKAELKEKLLDCGGVTDLSFTTTTYYRIPFQQAIRLLATRSVYLEAGFAFVPQQRLEAIILMRFRSYLSRALAEAALMFEVVNGDDRIGPLLKNLNKQYVGKDFNKTSSVDKLSPDKIDEAADMHMPLCMKALHSQLKKDHKLKHWGRLQYGLFLKGAGLDLQDALVFFETHFGKVMTHDQFVKDYSYSLRHMYGKEGQRKNYTPYSCMKIILGPAPQPGAVHGCPYRHASDTQLAAMLTSLKISSSDTKEIVQLAKGGGHYQLACQKHFDIAHPDHMSISAESQRGEAAANHPNAWFQASVKYHHAKSNPNANFVSNKTIANSSPTAVASTSEELTEEDMTELYAAEQSQGGAGRSALKRYLDEEENVDQAAMEAMMSMEGGI